MLNLSITDSDDNILYERKNQDLVLSYVNESNEFLINGVGDINDLLSISAKFLIFMYETITKSLRNEDYDIEDYLNEVTDLVVKELDKDSPNHLCNNVALRCSNPKDLPDATLLASALHNELKDKLPKDVEFIGLDYDELKNQVGEEDEEDD